jgi:hypothetical protein
MTTLARRNKTRWIKRMKACGCRYRRGHLWIPLKKWGVTISVERARMILVDAAATTLPKDPTVS